MVKNAAEALSGYVGEDPARANQVLDALGGRRISRMGLPEIKELFRHCGPH